jgi:hypothetical protein
MGYMEGALESGAAVARRIAARDKVAGVDTRPAFSAVNGIAATA